MQNADSDAGYSSLGQGFYGEVEAEGFEPAQPQNAPDAFYAYDDLADAQPAYQQQPAYGGGSYGGQSYGGYNNQPAYGGPSYGQSTPAPAAPVSDFAMLEDDDSELPF